MAGIGESAVTIADDHPYRGGQPVGLAEGITRSTPSRRSDSRRQARRDRGGVALKVDDAPADESESGA